jgi:hypothetical protein
MTKGEWLKLSVVADAITDLRVCIASGQFFPVAVDAELGRQEQVLRELLDEKVGMHEDASPVAEERE